MKKILIGLLTACMLTTTLAGCGGSPAKTASTPSKAADADATDKKDTEDKAGTSSVPAVNEDGTVNDPESVKVDKDKLVFWSLFSGGDGKFMDKIIEEYNATKPTKQVQSVMLVWGDYYTKLSTAVAANKGPDIGVSHISRLTELVEQGILQPIDENAKKSGTDWTKFNPLTEKGVTFDKQHYAMPLDTHAEVLYFNKDLVTKAGIPINEDGTVTIGSFDDFKAMLEKAKAVVGDGTALSLPQAADDPWRIWWSIYFQMGGTPILSDDGSKVTMDKAIAVKAAEQMNTLYTEGLIKAGIEDHQKYFQGGNAAFEFGGTWAIGVYESTEGFNYGAQPMPKLFEKEAGYADCHTLTLPTKKSRKAEDSQSSVDFINYVCSTGATTWAGSGQIPAFLDVANGDAFNTLPHRKEYKGAADIAVLPFNHARYGAMTTAMKTSLDSLWLGQTDATKAIDTMYDELQSNL